MEKNLEFFRKVLEIEMKRKMEKAVENGEKEFRIYCEGKLFTMDARFVLKE